MSDENEKKWIDITDHWNLRWGFSTVRDDLAELERRIPKTAEPRKSEMQAEYKECLKKLEKLKAQDKILRMKEKLAAPPHREQRHRQALQIVGLFVRWKLSVETFSALLGMPPEEFNRYRAGCANADYGEIVKHEECLLSIYEALQRLFPHNRDLAHRWIWMKNEETGNSAPVEMMKDGLEGQLYVRRLLLIKTRRPI